MRIRAKHIIPFCVIAAMAMFSPLVANAQIDAQLTQYWAVPAYYNPAATGNTDFIHITGGSRLQWLGIKHAPLSFHVLGDMPFKVLNKRVGVGVSLQQESIGLYRTLNAGAQGSFKFKLLGGTLSAGIQLGMINQTFKATEKVIPENDDAHTSTDDAIPETDVSGTAFDIGAGVFFQHKYFWAGASVAHINAPSVTLKASQEAEDQYEYNVGRFYYFMAGSNIPIKNTLFEIQPSVFVKSDLQFVGVEATARIRYNKFISGGVAYRHKDAVSLMIGAEFKNFYIGYSYDYPISDIRRATSGSHELFVSYNVKLDMGERNKNKHKSIRIM
ncbi:MAG: type IX secretion system membrane protein PorP/SprF [Muribaculaceae bacterium]|nr:type IX secretion system membrane protein PorP/SprF [Muribaculaceae bacterium]